MIINSKNNSKIKFAYSLKQKKYREESNLFLAEGEKNLLMAKEANCLVEVFSTYELDYLNLDCPVYLVDKTVIEKLSFEKNPEGIVFISKLPFFNKDLSLLNKIIYLDKISDPGNMGTIIRTALSFDYDLIVVSPNCVDATNEKVVSASKGSIYKMPIIKANLKEICKNKRVIVSSLNSNSIELSKIEKPNSFILVLGNESHGVSEESLSLASDVVKIEMSDKIDSLNVGVAAGILMYELR